MSDRLPKYLDDLNMNGAPGLVRADQPTLLQKRTSEASPEEVLALERAIRLGADYIYLRRPPSPQPPAAVAYLFDRTDRLRDTPDEDELADLHRRFWSAGDVPLAFVFSPSRVDVFHVLQGPKATQGRVRPSPWQVMETIQDAAEGLAALSAKHLDDGSFWESTASRRLDANGAAFAALLRQLGECRASLKREGEDDAVIKRILILFIFIKYLEERRDPDGFGVFPPDTFTRFGAAEDTFVDLISAGGEAVIRFVDHLARQDRFNGDVFSLSPDERAGLTGADLRAFTRVLHGKEDGGQLTLWRLYAFDELPIELISHLYEQFLPREPGVVYTPPFLVSFILDEVLPLSGRTAETFRLIDPACGSGVFLVAAFKRLVQRWRRDNGYQDPDVATLKKLLRDHIFGVDIEPEAIRIALFSLSVALCDFLKPRMIWEALHFDPLMGTNLFDQDFFLLSADGRWRDDAGFDLVVGNPPFKAEFSETAAATLASIQAEARTRGATQPEPPNKQLALLFLLEALRVARPGGEVTLILPAAPLLYNKNSRTFRRQLLETNHISQIVDLTHLSRELFKRPKTSDPQDRRSNNPGDVSIAVVFAERRPPTQEPLLHVTVRRTTPAEKRQQLEVDPYDLHFIPKREACESPTVWKANLVGGGRLVRLVDRLVRQRSLATYLEEMKEERGWEFGEGYIRGDARDVERLERLQEAAVVRPLSTAEEEKRTSLLRRFKQAPWLTGKVMLPTSAFTSTGVDPTKLETVEDRWFERPRTNRLFSGPLLLIKEVVSADSGRLPAILLDEGITFKDRIFGVHAPWGDQARLSRVYEHIREDRLSVFLLVATSGQYLVSRSSAVQLSDILDLPFFEHPQALSPLDEALIDDVLTYVADYKRTGASAAVLAQPTPDQLIAFGAWFVNVLGSVYPTLRAASPIWLSEAICYPFHFGDAPSEDLSNPALRAVRLEAILRVQVGESLRCQRVLRVFYGNMILLVKPAQLRYWLRSIAVRDADELFVHLQDAGY